MTTDKGTKVKVRVTKQEGKTYYETLSGLIAGSTLENRLTSDYSRRLQKKVTVKCPKVIEANDGDTTRCDLTPEGGKTHTLTVKVLDDRTGDFQVIPAKKA